MEVMKISPRTQAVMLLVSALLGVAAGILLDLIFLLRAGSYRVGGANKSRLYRHSFPLIGQIKERGRAYKYFTLPLAFAADLLLPLLWAAAQMCVFYAVDDGIFRLSGILASFLGTFAWRKTLGRPFRVFGEFLIFAVRVALEYLFYPMAVMLRIVTGTVKKSAKLFASFLRERRIKKYNVREWRRMNDFASDGFGIIGTQLPSRSEKNKKSQRIRSDHSVKTE